MTEILTKIIVCGGGCEPKCGKCGEQQVIPLTAEEIAEYQIQLEASMAAEQARQAEEAAKAEAKTSAESKLAALGLTAEEVSAILK